MPQPKTNSDAPRGDRRRTPYAIVARDTVGQVAQRAIDGDEGNFQVQVTDPEGELWVPLAFVEAVSAREAKTNFGRREDAVTLSGGRAIAAIPTRAITWETLGVRMVPKLEWGVAS